MPRFENGITQFVCVVLANNNNTSYEFLFSSFFRTSWLLTNTFFHARTSSTIIGNVQKRTNSLAHAILNLFTDLDTRSGSTKLTITGRIHSLSNWENVQTLRVFSFFWRIFLIYNQELLFCLSSRNMVMISIQKCFSVLFVFLPMVGGNESLSVFWIFHAFQRLNQFIDDTKKNAPAVRNTLAKWPIMAFGWNMYTCTLNAYLKYRHFCERACNCSRRTATELNRPPATVN